MINKTNEKNILVNYLNKTLNKIYLKINFTFSLLFWQLLYFFNL